MPTRLLTALLALLFVGCAHAQDNRPNILVIMADDLGFADVGCFGSEIQTPNLDALAANGLRFTQFYNTAKCHSSRVSLLTGLYCNQAGQETLSRGTTTAQVLKDAGYFTAMTGKWHLKDQPTDHGFERYWGHLSGATNFFTGDGTFRLNGEKWEVPDKDFYVTNANADYAIDFIDEAKTTDKPLYLYMAFNAPHYPLHCLEEDYKIYEHTYKGGWDAIRKARQDKQKQLGLFGDDYLKPAPRPDHVAAWKTLTAEEKDWEAQRMAAFAAMVHRMDLDIGRVLDHLKKNKMLDNTLVLFISDNGACPFDRTRGRGLPLRPWDPKSYWCYSPGWAHVGNTPFRLYKQNQHEGGITSPAIAYFPKGLKTKPGSITDQPAHLIDVMATVIELGNTAYPKTAGIDPLQGKSLVPIFEGKQRNPHEALYFNFSVNRAVRVGDMKLVSFRSSPWELYDLSKDRTELNNLAGQKPKLVKELSAKWQHWAEHVNHMNQKQRQPVKDTMQKPNF